MPERRSVTLAERILLVALDGDHEQMRFVLADLREERSALAARRGVGLARLWFWQELVRVAVQLRVGRWRSGGGSGPASRSGRDRVGPHRSYHQKTLNYSDE